ncbi:hypothetical protein EVAR_90083_1 [Eumeta japonica]|uniref:Uncharacterized protein n=1 Tax=Eumeta variegata TaxID=151549 RepID=A0A4C1X0D7_EUMVA|nr:hypothetical protein EVAR_90083_1 [Eumeta japonica]
MQLGDACLSRFSAMLLHRQITGEKLRRHRCRMIFSDFVSINVNFNPGLRFDSDPNHTFDCDPIPTLFFEPSPAFNFGPGATFDFDYGPVPDSGFRLAFNSNSTTSHSTDLNKAGV